MADFGTQLKKIRKNKKITQKELAKILGLAQTTIANYESNSRFPNQETLLKIADYFEVTLDYLITGKKKETEIEIEKSKDLVSLITKDPYFENNELAKKYLLYLLNYQKTEAKNLILAKAKKNDNKNNILDIYQNIFKSVLYKTGELWTAGKIGIEQEKFISNTTLEIMTLLKNNFSDVNSDSYKILGFASYQEKHNIGLKMIMDLFQLSGWNSIYYGNNLPIKNILQAISFHNPDVIAFSITAEENINSLIETINNIRAIYDQDELKIITGGYAARGLTERIKDLDVKVITEDISQIIKITEDLVES